MPSFTERHSPRCSQTPSSWLSKCFVVSAPLVQCFFLLLSTFQCFLSIIPLICFIWTHINPAAIIIVFIISPLCSCEGDSKVIKSAERILSIWEERGVYSGTLIADLKNALIKEESPPVTPVEQKSKFAYYFYNF